MAEPQVADLIGGIVEGLYEAGEGRCMLSLSTLEDSPGDLGERWVCGLEWGREAPDSDMAGAAAYGVGETVEQAMTEAIANAGWTNRG